MSSDLQIVVNLKGVFMGKLKEKLNENEENINFEKESFKEEEPNFNKETISEDIEEIFKTAFKFFNYK